jgi:hypothetical protein
MNKRQTDKIPSLKTYDNWPSVKEVERNKRLSVTQSKHIKKLNVNKRSDDDPINHIITSERNRSIESQRLKQTIFTMEKQLKDL